MSRVTAIPHLIPQTKMVKVMQALEKRAPRSTENFGGLTFMLKGDVYYSKDSSNEGKDVVNIGYYPTFGPLARGTAFDNRYVTKYGDMVYMKGTRVATISTDLPFLQTMVWGTGPKKGYSYPVNDDQLFYMEGDNFYDIMPVGSMIHSIRFDEAKPFHITDVMEPISGTNGKIANLPSVQVGRTSDNLVAIATLPGFIKEYGSGGGGFQYRYAVNQYDHSVITENVSDGYGHMICYHPNDVIAKWIKNNFDKIYLNGSNTITGTQNKVSGSCFAAVDSSLHGMPSSSNAYDMPSYTLLNMYNGTPAHKSITEFSGFIKISMRVK